MNEPIENVPSVPVHVASIAAEVQLGTPRDTRQYVLVPRTVILTSDEPVKQLAPPNPDRCRITIIANTNAIVLSRTKADAQAPGNLAATIAAPNGAYLPSGLPGVDVPETTSEIWGSTGTYPTMVTVLEVTRRA